MPGVCGIAGCGGRRVRTTALCERHYAATMERVRRELSAPRRPARRTAHAAKPTPTRLPRRVRAARLGRAVHAYGKLNFSDAVPVIGVTASAAHPIVKLARDAGWIVSRQGPDGGYWPGPVTPPAEGEG
jgi:hypothetical protein